MRLSGSTTSSQGGTKILFDKAGRDATGDFAIAHGLNNLRIESAMLPYRIGKLEKPTLNSLDEEAYKHCLEFLHSVCEIRNVFYLDVNMFTGGNESSASPHSLAMRAKTHKKFLTSSLPLLEAATMTCCEKTDNLQSNVLRLSRYVASAFRDLRKKLATCMSSCSDEHLYVATELCQIEKDFLSSVVETVAEFVADAEAGANVGTVADCFSAGLQHCCRYTFEAIEQLLDSISVVAVTSHDAEVIQKAVAHHNECSALAKLRLAGQEIPYLQLLQDETVFRSGDIIDLIYVVLHGSITAEGQESETDCFKVETAFGAVTCAAQIDTSMNHLGNQVMSYTAKVTSESCRVAILHPLQLLQPITTMPKEQPCRQSAHSPNCVRQLGMTRGSRLS